MTTLNQFATRSTKPQVQARKRSLPGMYMQLTKVRLSALVVLTTAVGFVMASVGPIDWMRLMWVVIGTLLTAGAASVFNQIAEIKLDRLMIRTKERPLPSGAMSTRHSFIFAMLLGYAGLTILWLLINFAAAGLALFTLLAYIFAYTPLKTRSTLNTIVGAVCGAIPPMIGWVAAAGTLDYGAWFLALLLFVWQIPHFLALAWLYRKDYERAGFAMLPVIDKTGQLTARVIVLTTLVLLCLSLTSTISGVAGWIYTIGSIALGLWLLKLAIGLHLNCTDAGARKVFLASLVYLPALLCLMMIDRGPVAPIYMASATASAAQISDSINDLIVDQQ
ncbi:MAG: protoheme IX farnesyltransferase [Planctomycetes bacterium]|nr:protoheme IX farnesyltransferase [Planctomycetota bacterium]